MADGKRKQPKKGSRAKASKKKNRKPPSKGRKGSAKKTPAKPKQKPSVKKSVPGPGQIKPVQAPSPAALLPEPKTKPKRRLSASALWERLPQDLIYKIVRWFIEGENDERVDSKDIAKRINKELLNRELDWKLTDQSIRRIMQQVALNDFLLFRPPAEEDERKYFAGFCRCDESQVHVVNFQDDNPLLVNQVVADQAADVCLRLIEQLAEKKREIHIGLGTGWTTRCVSRRLGMLLHTAHNLRQKGIKLVVHAISPGFDPKRPLVSPVAMFTLLENSAPEIQFVGLFTDPVVEASYYQNTKELPCVKYAFNEKEKIDLVISSIGSARHNGHWSNYVNDNPHVLQELRDLDWVGDFQFRPYSETRPITDGVSYRAMTLFELDEFRELARPEHPDKHVVLVCGPGKSDALIPVLREPELRIWDHVVFDVGTAQMIRDRISGGRS